MLSASEISSRIRMKKKKISENVDIIDTSPTPDMNATDLQEKADDAYIEEILESPEQSTPAEESPFMNPAMDTKDELKATRRMRLRAYLDGMKVSD